MAAPAEVAPGRYTRERLETIMAAARREPRPLMQRALRIQPKKRGSQPLLLNSAQKIIHETAQRLASSRNGIRLINLKARQEGASTYYEGRQFVMAAVNPGTRAFVVAHERKSARKLSKMSHRFIHGAPRWLGLDAKPEVDVIKLRRFRCSDGDVDIDSEIYVETAKGREVGRGDTVHIVHGSEVAFYENAERVMLGLLESVPDEPDTMVVLESTANGQKDEAGRANWFYETWLAAEDGQSEFVPLFLPWFALDEYRVEAPDSYQPETDDELALIELHGVDRDQLYWRKLKLERRFRGDLEKFQQEYPSSAEEAFRTSGDAAFSRTILAQYAKHAKGAPVEHGEVNHNPVIWVPRADGRYRIYQRPVADHEYLIGVDTCGGGESGDFAAMACIDRTTNDSVAVFRARLEPRVLAYEAAKLGRYYNLAMLAIEINNHGISTLNEVAEVIRYPAHALYHWRRYDNLDRAVTSKLGWLTTGQTRPLLIDDFSFALKQHYIGLWDQRQIWELAQFDRTNEKPGIDDLAIATLIMWHCHKVTVMKNGRTPDLNNERIFDPSEGADPMEQFRDCDPIAAREWKQVHDRVHLPREGGGLSRTAYEIFDAGVGIPSAAPTLWPGAPQPLAGVPYYGAKEPIPDYRW